MAGTFRAGLAQVRILPALRRVILVGLVFGAFTEGFDRLSVAHLIRDVGIPHVGGLGPQVWLGGLMMVETLLGLLVLRRIGDNRKEPQPKRRAYFARKAVARKRKAARR